MAYAISHPANAQAEKRLMDFMATQCDQYWYYQLRFCVPHLLLMMEQDFDLSPDELAEQVARIIREHCPIEETGDTMNHRQHALETQIRMITDELERIAGYQRHPARCHVPPQMFG